MISRLFQFLCGRYSGHQFNRYTHYCACGARDPEDVEDEKQLAAPLSEYKADRADAGKVKPANKEDGEQLDHCAAGRDGDCTHPQCPQNRDGEPMKSNRHCPLDTGSEEDL